MKSILITGISGFVGGHFSRFFFNKYPGCEIHGISRSKPAWDLGVESDPVKDAIRFHQCDLLDSEKTKQIIGDIQPDYILHLASFSSVAQSWNEPVISFLNNTNAFLNVVEAVRINDYSPRILSVGSSEEYGVVTKDNIPLSEQQMPSPANPYAVARVSEEYLANIYVKGYNLDICCTRSFNHMGPGQSAHFVISSLARQFAEIVRNNKKPVIKIGDGSIIRDFVDIDDVVRAYDCILEKGKTGEVYNVCSGNGHPIREIVDRLSGLTGIRVTVEQTPDLLRPIDNPILIGNYAKLKRDTGWQPMCPFNKSLEKLHTYWLNKLAT